MKAVKKSTNCIEKQSIRVSAFRSGWKFTGKVNVACQTTDSEKEVTGFSETNTQSGCF
ncbi:MAG TPA: hypothetical protein PLU53_12525 [Bacteroidia bacterium]|nr:hypothetical protein [Bacteroidia bacterium]